VKAGTGNIVDMTRVIAPPETGPALDAQPDGPRIGLLALVTDPTSERDCRRLVADSEAAFYVNRVPYSNPLNETNLHAMQPHLHAAAECILPGEPLDALVFACTSASALIGDDTIRATLAAARPGVATVTPTAGAAASFRALGVERVAVLAPYSHAISTALAAYFDAALGVSVTKLQYLGYDNDRAIARIPHDWLVETTAELAASDPDAEALFVSCTALRAAPIVPRLEAITGKAVVTSNQAMIWHSLRLAGARHPIPAMGELGRV
jgi:maleate isomerase